MWIIRNVNWTSQVTQNQKHNATLFCTKISMQLLREPISQHFCFKTTSLSCQGCSCFNFPLCDWTMNSFYKMNWCDSLCHYGNESLWWTYVMCLFLYCCLAPLCLQVSKSLMLFQILEMMQWVLTANKVNSYMIKTLCAMNIVLNLLHQNITVMQYVYYLYIWFQLFFFSCIISSISLLPEFIYMILFYLPKTH